jgi:hypothetical protein
MSLHHGAWVHGVRTYRSDVSVSSWAEILLTYGRRGAGCQRKKKREARLDYVEDTLESQGQGIKTLEKIFRRQEDRRTKRMGREERLSEPTARTRRRREESPRETHEEKVPSTERPRGSRCAAPEQEAQASI